MPAACLPEGGPGSPGHVGAPPPGSLAWCGSGRGDASQGVAWPRVQRLRRQALPGAQCPATQAQASMRPGPGVVTAPAYHCLGRPMSHSCRRGLASQGHNPHPLKGWATVKGPRQGITAGFSLRWAPGPGHSVVEGGGRHHSLARRCPHPQHHPPGPAPTAQPAMGTGEWSVSIQPLLQPPRLPLSHRTLDGSQPHSPGHPRPPSPATTGLGEVPGAPEVGLRQVAGRAAGNGAP